MIIKIFQLHKREASVFEKIEDQYAVNPEKNVYALADGASQKIWSALWAKRLVESFVKEPAFEANAFKQKVLSLAEAFDNEENPFSTNLAIKAVEKKKAALGASCTFLGVTIERNGEGKLIACGDSNFFQFRKQKMINYFPYKDWQGVKNNSDFLNTKRVKGKDHDDTIIKTESFKFLDEDILVLASDALSCLIFKQQEIIDQLWAIQDFDKFLKFCEQHWDNKTLTEDDISVIIIRLSKGKEIKKILPPEGFAFSNPVVPILNYIPNQNNDMKEVRQKINRVGNEKKDLIRELEQKMAKTKRLIVLLLGVGIFLTLVNCVFLFANLKSLGALQGHVKIDPKIEVLKNRLNPYEQHLKGHNNKSHNNHDAITTNHSDKKETESPDSLPSKSTEIKSLQSGEKAASQKLIKKKDSPLPKSKEKKKSPDLQPFPKVQPQNNKTK